MIGRRIQWASELFVVFNISEARIDKCGNAFVSTGATAPINMLAGSNNGTALVN